MRMSSLSKKIITGVLVGSVVLSLGVTALAADNNEASTLRERVKFRKEFKRPKDELMIVLDRLIEEGTITEEQSNSIKQYIEQKIEEKRHSIPPALKKDLLGELVEEGVLTEDIVDVIRNEHRELRHEKVQESLNNLVEEEVISENDVENIIDFMEQKAEERMEELDKIKNMTEVQRREYFMKKRGERKNIMSQMIEEDIITEEQAEEIRKVLPRPEHHKRPMGHFRKNRKKGPRF
ncbi:hypothetical protein [Caldisalinibacter kiritimatiensis]|uniref:CARD domain-containing protein n=1 Tax=Caldisalinibacter kiritimatiensis TaxID=1304284 RepID=R1CR15_9FIRM|nr:hypothetical protein [Caldisalinibacter kiritimatiensis]EOD01111.1 hypothetical protein L21TH_0822 [Caldisalinibacter kiritimatiensis]